MEALLVVDVQVDMVEPEPAYRVRETIDTLVRLRAAAAANGVPIVFVRNNGEPGEPDIPGSPGWELHPDLSPGPADPIIDKRQQNAFAGTGLADLLTGLGVDTVVVGGLQSEFCIRATTLGAIEAGFEAVLIEDGHTTFGAGGRAQEILERVNAELEGVARLENADAIVARWGSR